MTHDDPLLVHTSAMLLDSTDTLFRCGVLQFATIMSAGAFSLTGLDYWRESDFDSVTDRHRQCGLSMRFHVAQDAACGQSPMGDSLVRIVLSAHTCRLYEG
jgi:hypothetical protein